MQLYDSVVFSLSKEYSNRYKIDENFKRFTCFIGIQKDCTFLSIDNLGKSEENLSLLLLA